MTRADAGAWLRMRAALWPDEDPAELAVEVQEFYDGRLQEPLAVLLAISEGGEPAGVAELSIRSYAEDCESDRVAYLEGWYVTPEWRQHGVGRQLIEAAEQWALAQGCSEFGSDALIDNEVSAAAHRALGFAESAEIRCFRKALPAAAHARAAALIAQLSLRPHPEGGHFAEVFRSAASVTPADGRGPRAALTTIYYLLTTDEVSRWHRVRSDEVWHFYEGAPLELLVLSADGQQLNAYRLGPMARGATPTVTVKAGEWQAAQPIGGYTLAGCTVAPGFEFSDFVLARDDRALADAIRTRHPRLARFL